MPIPTDNFWNIKKLNVIFAISMIALFAITFAAVNQDYLRSWRKPQQQGRVWNAALTEEKIERDNTPELKARVEQLSTDIKAKTDALEASAEYNDVVGQIKTFESEASNMEFSLNNKKSDLTVLEVNLQDAITAGDQNRIDELQKKIASPRAEVAAGTLAVTNKKDELAEAKKKRDALTAERDALQKEKIKLTADIDALEKKSQGLVPKSPLQKLSEKMRTEIPLFPFPTGMDRVQQVVLPDIQNDMVAQRVAQIDRCMTCHVNINKKEFSEPSVLGYLEEQLATARGYRFAAADPSKPNQPTAEKPGPVAMSEFWHHWGRKLLSPASLKKAESQVKSIAGAVGKTTAPVMFDGKPVAAPFSFDERVTTRPTIISEDEQRRQDAVLAAAIDALAKEDPENKALATQKNNALAYPERLRSMLQAELTPEAYNQLEERYRYALVERVNEARDEKGLRPLDASPVLLAHPHLDLYVDVDSKHSFESVGCTSCHDGSGLETSFVLAAHSARPIWVDAKTGEPVLPQQLRPKDPEKLAGHHGPDMSSMLDAVYPNKDGVPHGASDLHLNLNGSTHAGSPAESLAVSRAEVPASGPAKPQATPAAAPSDHTAAHPDAHEDHHDVQFAAPPTDPAAAKASPTVPYVDPVTGRTGKAVAQLKHWGDKYEFESGTSFKDVYHYWDTPMRPPQYIQANCVRCHTDVYDIKEHAPVLFEGRSLFVGMGCVNCHQMDTVPAYENRRVGTDLRHVTSKLSPAFINTWMWAPKAFRPTTKMPHFFMLENSSSDEEIRRTRQEARAITEYIVETSKPQEPASLWPSDIKGKKEDGQKLFNSIGCLGCHSNLNETGEKWITTDLVKRAGLKQPEAKKHYEEMTYNERHLYALEHLSPPEIGYTEPPKYPDGSPKPNFMTHGPELSGIGSKLLADRKPEEARGWLFDWLKNPRHYSAYTVMPNLRLSDQQAADMTEYLLEQTRKKSKADDEWSAELTPTDPDKLRELTSFFLRSRMSLKNAYDKANNHEELNTLAASAITTPGSDPEEVKTRVAGMSVEKKQMLFLGQKLIGHYGCMQCHAINGTEEMTTPCANLTGWGQKSLTQLAFEFLDHHKSEGLPPAKIPMVNGLSEQSVKLAHGEMKPDASVARDVTVAWPHTEHTRESWITQKLKNTRVYDRGRNSLEPKRQTTGKPAMNADGIPIAEDQGKPYDKLKMPTFYLSDEQVDAIVTWVISNRERLITPQLINKTTDDEAKRIAHGRMLVEQYNCVSCHQVEHNVPAVQQYYPTSDIATKAPPSLRGEGNKIQHDWLHNFLQNVQTLRPTPVIRMPSFPVTPEEATAIASYFAAASNKESTDLKKIIDPIVKWIGDEKKAGGSGDDWWRRASFQASRDVLVGWALQHNQITELQLDPSKNKTSELDKNYHLVLFKAQFTTGLYDAPYPFVSAGYPQISDDRFKLGEQFFYDMQCLKCHVLGDPNIDGANKTPTAPNLSLAYERLQRRWVRHWVQEPPVIQAGTAMPPYFTGLTPAADPAFALHGQGWPKGQELPPGRTEYVEAKYGKTVEEQTSLLLDFLYVAGATGYTGVQPAKTAIDDVVEKAPTTAPTTAPVATETKPEEKPPAEEAPKPAAGGVTLSGKVMFDGDVPEPGFIQLDAACLKNHPPAVVAAGGVDDPSLVVSGKKEIKNVIVAISSGVQGDFPAPQKSAVLDQVGCIYEPHVLALRVGQPLSVKNTDALMHNVQLQPQKNPPMNFSQNNVDPGKDVGALKAAEIFPVKCQVHPWMQAYIGVFDHPFFSVTDASGAFTIPNLPPGQYTLTAWHEKLGTQEQEITVEAGRKPAEVKFTFKP